VKRFLKPFGMSFALAGALGVADFFASSLVPEVHHGCMMICVAVFLWAITLAVAAIQKPFVTQFGTAAGFSWGYLVLLSVAISINNGRVSVNWPTMLPALIAIPLVVQLTALPVYAVSKMIQRKQTAKPETEDR